MFNMKNEILNEEVLKIIEEIGFEEFQKNLIEQGHFCYLFLLAQEINSKIMMVSYIVRVITSVFRVDEMGRKIKDLEEKEE